MKGELTVVGLGPGSEELIIPSVKKAIAQATDIVGYFRYTDRISKKRDQKIYSSDNRQELERAELALKLASEGGKVVVVSSGDPGVFAMASAVFEVLEKNVFYKNAIKVTILPGITAILAASARIGAPIGHDFCAINLSDNLKSWNVVKKRVVYAAKGDFVMAFYNPRSKTRVSQLEKIFDVLKKHCEPNRLVVFANAISKKNEKIISTTLENVDTSTVSMQTLVIVGSSATRKISGTEYIYTPRYAT
jgi:precorrin-3B C17-methyltransferase